MANKIDGSGQVLYKDFRVDFGESRVLIPLTPPIEYGAKCKFFGKSEYLRGAQEIRQKRGLSDHEFKNLYPMEAKRERVLQKAREGKVHLLSESDYGLEVTSREAKKAVEKHREFELEIFCHLVNGMHEKFVQPPKWKCNARGKAPENSFIPKHKILFAHKRTNSDVPIKPYDIARQALAARSPQSAESWEKVLVHGLATGQGAFQFVAPGIGDKSFESGEPGIIDELIRRMQELKQVDMAPSFNPLVLGGRFQVTNLEEVRAADRRHRCVKITVVDLDNPGSTKTAFFTQARLKFDGGILSASDIIRADAMMASHRSWTKAANNTQFSNDPVVISRAGVGRNAALICYREALCRLGQLNTKDEIGPMLLQVISEAQRDRGPAFLWSEKQMNEVKAALIHQFDQSGERIARISPSVPTDQHATRKAAQIFNGPPNVLSRVLYPIQEDSAEDREEERRVQFASQEVERSKGPFKYVNDPTRQPKSCLKR